MKVPFSFNQGGRLGTAGRWLVTIAALTGLQANVAAAIIDAPANRGDVPGKANTYADLDLAELLSVEVTSVAGTAQDPFFAPAAISVLTPEDIDRTGHQHVAGALSVLPGVQTERINAHEWAVSIRGFNDQFANKLQVLQDGRSLYDPLFAGVRWQNVDMILDDIERIEVVRGPGATLWGANAVNGVINITTKSARDTQGLYVKQVVGSEWESITAGRYGGKVDDETFYRVWGKYVEHDSFNAPNGPNFDDWGMVHGGFRVDRDIDVNRHLMIEGGGFYSGRTGEQIPLGVPSVPFATVYHTGDNEIQGAHLLAEISQEDVTGGWRLLGYHDYHARDMLDGLEERRHTLSAEWRHWVDWGDRHELIWGLGYRFDTYHTDPGQAISFTPDSDELNLFSAFVQDTVELAEDRLFAMGGVKLEHNGYTGLEVQPSARVWWTPGDRQMLWAAVSHAVRRPSPSDRDINITLAYTPPPPMGDPDGRMELRGTDVGAEDLIALEAGHRFRPDEAVRFDTAAFYNRYDNLTSAAMRGFDMLINNEGKASTYGLETSLAWQPTPSLQFGGSYSLLMVDIDDDGGRWSDRSPNHQFRFRADASLTDEVALHGVLYYNDQYLDLPARWQLDTGVSWQARENIDLAVWGQNLLDARQRTFIDAGTTATEVERGVYAQVRIRF
ncbi:MAG: TonB-dependent receptor plug domain-containing protein [Phycisphaeraceae bacterium]